MEKVERKTSRARDVSAASRKIRAWVLADDKAGHTTQSVGLAEALGFDYEVKDLRFNRFERLSNRLLGATLISLDRARSAPLVPPWPDVVIATGRRSAPAARWVARQSDGQARLIQLGRKGGERPETFDVLVSCAHFGLPPHPHRVETLTVQNAMSPAHLAEAAQRWRGIFADAPRPHVVLVVGGVTARHVFDAADAERLGAEAAAFAKSTGGSLFAITSPRTGAAAAEALARAIGSNGRVHRWARGQSENPYAGYLALADVLIVTGESESMLSEAAATAAPLLIYPLRERPAGRGRRLRAWTAKTARAGGDGDTEASHSLLGAACAWLIEAGLMRTNRNLTALHEGLIRAGVARRFGDPIAIERRAPLYETPSVAARVRALLDLPDAKPSGDTEVSTLVLRRYGEREERHRFAGRPL